MGRSNLHNPPVLGFDQLPSAFMHQPMVPMAEQDQVGQLGVSTIDPVHEVVSVAS